MVVDVKITDLSISDLSAILADAAECDSPVLINDDLDFYDCYGNTNYCKEHGHDVPLEDKAAAILDMGGGVNFIKETDTDSINVAIFKRDFLKALSNPIGYEYLRLILSGAGSIYDAMGALNIVIKSKTR